MHHIAEQQPLHLQAWLPWPQPTVLALIIVQALIACVTAKRILHPARSWSKQNVHRAFATIVGCELNKIPGSIKHQAVHCVLVQGVPSRRGREPCMQGNARGMAGGKLKT